MNMQSPTKQQLEGVWVCLHMVAQTEGAGMPETFTGFLVEETPGAYVLAKTVQMTEDEDTYELTAVEVEEMNFVNRTYVWRCQILSKSPLEDASPELAFFDTGGGMG